MKSAQVAFRIEPELVELAEEIAEMIGETSVTGSRPTQAEVLRGALRRGLEAMKEDLVQKGAKRKRR